MINKVSSNYSISPISQQKKETQKTENTEKDRVEEIKTQIENNTYKIDIKASAEALAKHLL